MPATLPVSYTSVPIVLAAFPAIGSAANLSSSTIVLYGGQEEAYINAKLSKLYSLPFTTDIPILTALATDLTIAALLTKRVSAHFTTVQNKDNPFIELRKRAMDVIDELADGSVQMVDSSGQIVATASGNVEVYSTTMNYVPTFHEGDWNDMVIDPAKLDDILAARGF